MRKYNSSTDREIIRTAIAKVGTAGGTLSASKEALELAGIEWPVSFNNSREPDAIAIDHDINEVVACLRSSD